MAKFYSKKNKNKHLPTPSQVSGIVWIIATLSLIIAIKYFSTYEDQENYIFDSTMAENTSNMQNLGDSTYRSRRYAEDARKPRRHRTNSSSNPSALYSHTLPPPTRQPLTVELNSADTITLQLLHGIGPTLSRRMVRYRDRLGGFHSTSQLLEVYGFTPALLEHIAPYLTLDSTNIAHMPVNSITLKELIRHPYVDYYFARDLVTLRSKGVIFKTSEDLRAIPSASDTMLTRLLPYLDFSLSSGN